MNIITIRCHAGAEQQRQWQSRQPNNTLFYTLVLKLSQCPYLDACSHKFNKRHRNDFHIENFLSITLPYVHTDTELRVSSCQVAIQADENP